MLTPLTDDDPRTIGPYRVQGRLGAGGMGAVYLGFTDAGRAVAVKVARAALAEVPDFRARFRQEVAAARRVRSARVAEVLDADVDASQPWLVTEYVEGVSLADAVEQRGPLEERLLLGLAVGLADALVAVHAAGVVHRDLKPANVVLAWDGPKVIDFGIARSTDATSRTRPGFLIGTLTWMAPEQLRGEPATPASDVFAWGTCVAYAAMGRPPFDAEQPEAVAVRVLSDRPDLDGVPASVAGPVARALAKEPGRRPRATEIAAALLGRPAVRAAEVDDAASRLLDRTWTAPTAAPAPPYPRPARSTPPPPYAAPPSYAAPRRSTPPPPYGYGQPPPTRPAPAATPPPAPPGGGAPGRRPRRAGVALGVAAAVAVVTGGIGAGVALSRHSSPARTAGTSSVTASVPPPSPGPTTPARTTPARTTPAVPTVGPSTPATPTVSTGTPPPPTPTRSLVPVASLAEARTVVRDRGYVPDPAATFNPDARLNVVTATARDSADGYAQQAFFFADGRYIGTDTSDPSAGVRPVWSTGDAVALEYPLYRPDDPMCCPTGGSATVRYQWNGSRLVPLDPIPPSEAATTGRRDVT